MIADTGIGPASLQQEYRATRQGKTAMLYTTRYDVSFLDSQGDLQHTTITVLTTEKRSQSCQNAMHHIINTGTRFEARVRGCEILSLTRDEDLPVELRSSDCDWPDFAALDEMAPEFIASLSAGMMKDSIDGTPEHATAVVLPFARKLQAA
jgi:hypothetical protein